MICQKCMQYSNTVVFKQVWFLIKHKGRVLYQNLISTYKWSTMQSLAIYARTTANHCGHIPAPEQKQNDAIQKMFETC